MGEPQATESGGSILTKALFGLILKMPPSSGRSVNECVCVHSRGHTHGSHPRCAFLVPAGMSR